MNEILSQLMSRETDINDVNVIVNDVSSDAAAAAAAAASASASAAVLDDKSRTAVAGRNTSHAVNGHLCVVNYYDDVSV